MRTKLFSIALLLGFLASLNAQELTISTGSETSFNHAQKPAVLSPDSPADYYNLGYSCLEKKEMDKAKTAFEKYLEVAPSAPKAHDSMGDYYLATGDYHEAAMCFEKAAALGLESSNKKAEEAWAAKAQEAIEQSGIWKIGSPKSW